MKAGWTYLRVPMKWGGDSITNPAGLRHTSKRRIARLSASQGESRVFYLLINRFRPGTFIDKVRASCPLLVWYLAPFGRRGPLRIPIATPVSYLFGQVKRMAGNVVQNQLL